MNVDELEAWVDESIRRVRRRGYYPGDFIRMRQRNGGQSREVIERLVKSGEVQSGLRRTVKLGLIDWSLEMAVRKFPELFSPEARQCADFRLDVLAKEL